MVAMVVHISRILGGVSPGFTGASTRSLGYPKPPKPFKQCNVNRFMVKISMMKSIPTPD
jgi:hypothetical protein